jgi:hypothetical protein
MKKYLVKIKEPKFRDELVKMFDKVGEAEALADFLIVETDLAIERILECEGVLMVEEDQDAEPVESFDGSADSKTLDVGWGLPWISNADKYQNEKTGLGVDIYVIDSGVRETHDDLDRRVRTLYSFDSQPYSVTGGPSPTHGTSVAGCAAGSTFGTAPGATIVNCRINWTTTDILKALDKVARDHLDKPDHFCSIVNFSGSTLSRIIGDAFEQLVHYGIVVVAAAGNDSENQPRYPARSAWVLSVGAINSQNEPAWFTNKECDIYAPGQDVRTISVFSDSAVTIISGSSFSGPYTAGLFACLLQGSDKFNTSSHVSDFNHRMLNQIMEKNRLPNFLVERNMSVRTATSKGLGGGVFYTSPIKDVPDEDIKNWLFINANDPQMVADACKTYNLSLSRMNRVTGSEIGISDINQYFENAGVSPWWKTT